jgi:hypothetical protein
MGTVAQVLRYRLHEQRAYKDGCTYRVHFLLPTLISLAATSSIESVTLGAGSLL